MTNLYRTPRVELIINSTSDDFQERLKIGDVAYVYFYGNPFSLKIEDSSHVGERRITLSTREQVESVERWFLLNAKYSFLNRARLQICKKWCTK